MPKPVETILRCIAGSTVTPNAHGEVYSIEALQQMRDSLSTTPGVGLTWIEDGTLYVEVEARAVELVTAPEEVQ